MSLSSASWSALLAILASRGTVWARGRISISVALIFAPLITATFVHIGELAPASR